MARTLLFADAIKWLDDAFEQADVDAETLERLKFPKAVVQVSIPLRMDNGSLRIFEGYRMRHDDARESAKGEIRTCGAGWVQHDALRFFPVVSPAFLPRRLATTQVLFS